MKRKIGTILIAVMMLVAMTVTPAHADAPTYEEWRFASFNNNIVTVSYIINTTTLKTTQFNIVNNSDEPVYIYIMEKGDLYWDFLVEGQTTASKSCVVNFGRVPHDDPDDPDSVRMPPNTYFFARYPAF